MTTESSRETRGLALGSSALAGQQTLMRRRRRDIVLRLMILFPVVAALAFAPIVVGALPVLPESVPLALVCALALYAFGGFGASARARKVAVAALSACASVACFDLVARPIVAHLSGERARELSVHTWEPMPLVFRYDAGVRYDGTTYGDLSAMSLDKSLREYREYRFRTDAYGFRNETTNATAQPADVILLGDSFGVGAGTTQDATWASLLAREHGLAVYNLSIEGAGAWQELINFELEIDRVRPREGAVVLWSIFSGNDLDDPYYAPLKVSELPWQGRLARLSFALKKFRYRSPLRRIIVPVAGAWDSRENVIVRDFFGARKILFYAPYDASRRRTREDVRRHPNFVALHDVIAEMKRLTDERHLRLAVVCLPSKEEVYSWALDGVQPWSTVAEPSGFAAALGELCRERGIAFLDLKPRMLAESRRAFDESHELLWWWDDTHWNAAGHKAAASAIYEELLRPTSASARVSGVGEKVHGAGGG
jgi:hypothetical protein